LRSANYDNIYTNVHWVHDRSNPESEVWLYQGGEDITMVWQEEQEVYGFKLMRIVIKDKESWEEFFKDPYKYSEIMIIDESRMIKVDLNDVQPVAGENQEIIITIKKPE
jgi:coproporphyrinogen III oxidase